MKWLGKNIYSLESVFNSKAVFKDDIIFAGAAININTTFNNTETPDNFGTINVYARDLNIFNDEIDSSSDTTSGDPTFRLGSSLTECLEIHSNYQTSTTSMQIAVFKTLTASATVNDGRFRFVVDEVPILEIDDGGIDFWAGFVGGISFNGTDIITDDGSGTTTLSNIDAIDSGTADAIATAISAGDITGVRITTDDGNVASDGTASADFGLAGGTGIQTSSSGANITIAGTDATTSSKGIAQFSSDNFSASSGTITIKSGGVDLTDEVTGVLPSANLDADTAHLSVTQTFTGVKTFSQLTIMDGDRNMDASEAAFLHMDASTLTDNNTSGSGTAPHFFAVNLEGPTLAAVEASVTTTDAATLRIMSAVTAGTNQTITRSWSLWVDSGNARFDGSIYSGTTEAMNSSGLLTVANQSNITGVGTISSGTWQGTAIASAYLDADTSHISTQRVMTFHGFTDDIDTTKHYVGLLDADSENTASTNGDLPFVVPNGGKLLKVFLRANSNRSSNTFTWRLETQDTSTAAGTGPSVIGTQSGAGCTNKTMTTYDFTTGLDSGTNVIGSGDMAFLSIESDSATSSTKYFISCLWEINLS